MRRPFALFFALALSAAPAGDATAGLLISPQARLGVYSLRAEAAESTPNYYGYGAALTTGWSFGQVLDVAGFYSHQPGRLESAKLGVSDALLTAYGAEVGLRPGSLYIGARLGRARYELPHRQGPDEIAGTWSGPSGGLAIGAVIPLTKQSFVQTCFEVMHTVMQRDALPADEDAAAAASAHHRRRLDAFALSLAYVYAGEGRSRFDSSIFKDFLDGLTFF